MKGFLGLTKRNLLLFFKDRQTVVFSMLTSIIVLVLYLLFLKDAFVSSMTGAISDYPGIRERITDAEIDMCTNLFLLTGILGSAMITVSYNCLTTLVKDRENKVDYDILATPIGRGRIILSYFVSAALSSILLTGVILTIGLAVIGTQGSLCMDTTQVLAAYGIVALGSVSATAVFMIVVMFFKSTGASGAFFGILSAASGFVIGAYMPISSFSSGVQTVCNLFPASHVTILLRNVLMNGILGHMNDSIGGIDDGMFVDGMKKFYCFNAQMFGSRFSVGAMILYVLAALLVCLAVQVIVFARTYKKK